MRNVGRGLIEGRAVAAGLVVALAIAVPTIVISSVLGVGTRSNMVFVPFLIYLVGLGIGGWWAARRQPDAPLSNGAVTAIAAYALIAVVASVIRAVSGRPLDAVSLVFNAFLAASAGIFGGLVATWRTPSAEAGDRRP